MKVTRIVQFLGFLLLLSLLATNVASQGFPTLPRKASPDALPRPPGMERSGSVEETLALVAQHSIGLDSLEARVLSAISGTDTLVATDRSPGEHRFARRDILVNQDFNFRPQNETAITVNPHDSRHIVTGYNDYRVGWPIGGGFSTSFDQGRTWHDGLVTFPALVSAEGIVEPPVGTGDPAVAFANDGTVYHSSLGFSATWCENGLFVYRSDDGGISWWRPVVDSGLGLVDYWPYAFDCSVFLDKEYMTVDNSGRRHDGRVYVTYTRFLFDVQDPDDPLDDIYLESPIYLSYSDDGGVSWTVVGEINGVSEELCEHQEDTTGGEGLGATGPDATDHDCDENQFSYPVVGSDGTLYVHFFNEQNASEWEAFGETGPETEDFDDQILVVAIDPDTFAISGPYHVDMMADGLTNYPLSPFNNRQTVCNGGWRLIAAGNIAIGPDDELYVTWADNRNGDEFPFPTFVSEEDGSCPDDLHTSTDVFISKSTDRGATWSDPVKITGDPPNFDNWFPWVDVGDHGEVGVVYYDRRASGDNTLTDAWVAASQDGGETWRERRVSDESSDFFNAFFGTPSFIGDYNGLAIADGMAYPFWTDSRVDGDSDVYMDVLRADGR